MAKNNKPILILTSIITVSLVIIAASLVWIGYNSFINKSRSTTAATGGSVSPTNNSSSSAITLDSKRNVDYTKLREDLQQKNLEAADRETYLRLLDAAGPKAQAQGFTPQDEMENFPCTDLRTVDSLWSAASDGKLGFTAQQQILRALGDYRKMYDQVGWQKQNGEWLIEWNYNPQTKRMEYKPGKEPNFKNPRPGHLPTMERGYNFDISLNAALNRCGF